MSTQGPVRRTLSRHRILDAAEELLSSEDRAAFTMRQLADRLGVTPMAIYRWFANKDELLVALTDRVADTSVVMTLPEGSWETRALAYALGIRERLLRALPLLRVEGASRRLESLIVRNCDPGLALVTELGYRDAEAVEAFRVLFWSVLDHCLVIDATDALPTEANGRDVIVNMTDLAGPDLETQMPHLAGLLPYFTAVDPEAFFVRSISTVLAGLRATAPDQRSSDDVAG
jgi:AcrR family transcriptional regulator